MPTDYLKPSDVARRLNVCPESVRKLCREGRLPCLRVGAQYRIPFAEAEKLLQAAADATPAGTPAAVPDTIPAAE